jgi:predicted transcriptional regulator
VDALAAAAGRDRSEVIGEAVQAWPDVQRWQAGHIAEVLR